MKCVPVVLQLKEAEGPSFGKGKPEENLNFVLLACNIKHYLGSYSWIFLCLELQIRFLISPCHCLFPVFHLQHLNEATVSAPARPETMTLCHEWK